MNYRKLMVCKSKITERTKFCHILPALQHLFGPAVIFSPVGFTLAYCNHISFPYLLNL